MQPVVYLGNGLWLMQWNSDLTPPVTSYMWVNGVLIAQTLLTQITLYVDSGDQLEVFVYDDPNVRPPIYYPNRVEIYWLATLDTARYRVEQWDGTSWITVHTQLEVGATSYLRQSGVLEDQTSYQYRVVAVGASDNESIVHSLNVFMVRRPDVPSISWTYDEATRQVTLDT